MFSGVSDGVSLRKTIIYILEFENCLVLGKIILPRREDVLII